MDSLLEFEVGVKDKIECIEAYQQYSQDPVINDCFRVLKDSFFEYHTQTIKSGILQQQWSFEGDNPYLQYYIESLYGFFRSFGEAIINNQYDTGLQYDTALLYDDASFDGFMGLPYYKKLVKWFLNYQYNTFTPTWLWSLVNDFCETSDFTFTFNDFNAQVNMRTSVESIQLQRIFSNRQVYGNTPITPITFNLTS